MVSGFGGPKVNPVFAALSLVDGNGNGVVERDGPGERYDLRCDIDGDGRIELMEAKLFVQEKAKAEAAPQRIFSLTAKEYRGLAAKLEKGLKRLEGTTNLAFRAQALKSWLAPLKSLEPSQTDLMRRMEKAIASAEAEFARPGALDGCRRAIAAASGEQNPMLRFLKTSNAILTMADYGFIDEAVMALGSLDEVLQKGEVMSAIGWKMMQTGKGEEKAIPLFRRAIRLGLRTENYPFGVDLQSSYLKGIARQMSDAGLPKARISVLFAEEGVSLACVESPNVGMGFRRSCFQKRP